MIRAAAILVVGFAVALSLLVLAVAFDLNGEQWAWWSSLSWVAAALALVLTVQAARGRPGGARRRHAAAAGGGAAVAAVSAVVMASSYSDPYAGPLLWPRVLACLAFAGFAVASVGAYLLASVRR